MTKGKEGEREDGRKEGRKKGKREKKKFFEGFHDEDELKYLPFLRGPSGPTKGPE